MEAAPEVFELSMKVREGRGLSKVDEWNLNEIAEASGWDVEDVVEDLKSLGADPRKRRRRCRSLFEKYFGQAMELRDRGNDVGAAGKLWGAITALVKAHADERGVSVEYWSKRSLDRFVSSFVKEEAREKFEDLLTYGGELHRHFCVERLPRKLFERRWSECVELIREILEARRAGGGIRRVGEGA